MEYDVKYNGLISLNFVAGMSRSLSLRKRCVLRSIDIRKDNPSLPKPSKERKKRKSDSLVWEVFRVDMQLLHDHWRVGPKK